MTVAAERACAPALVASMCLASASPRRSAILSDAGFTFDVEAARVDESASGAVADPSARAIAIARAKAAAVALRRPHEITLAADTLVVLDDRVLGKPRDPVEALGTLRRLSGQSHLVVTGVAVDGVAGRTAGAETTAVRFRDLSDSEIAAYVATGAPFDKAGGYGIQDRPFLPAAGIAGCYLNVVGLPLCLAHRLLDEAGALRPGLRPAPAACPGHDRIEVPA